MDAIAKYTAFDIASYILHFFQECGSPISNLKLQKLLYYVQGWHLASENMPLFNEDFQAWVHGPVIPEVYQKYKCYKWHDIEDEEKAIDIDIKAKEVIYEVLSTYGTKDAWWLELKTHSETPWIKARGGLNIDAACSNTITKKSMFNFFLLEYNNEED